MSSPASSTAVFEAAGDRSRLSLLRTAFHEERFFLILSVFIGLFSGLAVVCFRVAIDWSRIALLGPVAQPWHVRLVLAPALVSLLVAVLM